MALTTTFTPPSSTLAVNSTHPESSTQVTHPQYPWPFCTIINTSYILLQYYNSSTLLPHPHLQLHSLLKYLPILHLLRQPSLPISPVDCSTMALLQSNIQGFFSHRPYICHLICSNNPPTICLQETFLPQPPVPIPKYHFVSFPHSLCLLSTHPSRNTIHYTSCSNCCPLHYLPSLLDHKCFNLLFPF